MDELLLTAGTQIPTLPNGESPVPSITGNPSVKEGQGFLSSVWDFYSGFWGKVGDIVSGDEDSFYGKDQQSDEIQTNKQSSYSPSLLVIFLLGAGFIYLTRRG
jgi:hypothetical protein